MAQPILLIRIDGSFFSAEQRQALKASLSAVEQEYHIICTNVGAPKESFSFEVHGVVTNNTDDIANMLNVGVSKWPL